MRLHLITLIIILTFGIVMTALTDASPAKTATPVEQLMSFDEGDTIYADEVVTEYVFAGDELVLDIPATN